MAAFDPGAHVESRGGAAAARERPAATTADPATASYFFRRQGVHVVAIAVLVPVAWGLAAPALDSGRWLGLSDTAWFAICLAVAVVHQVYVWISWRAQLGWQVYTRVFGKADFAVYGSVFFVFLILRPLLVAAIALADPGSLLLPPRLVLALAVLLSVPATYTAWSVARWFGLARAAGGDHFRRRYREMPLVDEGAFAWTPNAMYTLGFLGLWAIALFGRSHVALVAALFQHAYIWVHYLCTEQPDMELLYGAAGGGDR